ncbi:GGDEF domain-containing protein [Streptococcus henryi]|uniref:GGDEF domain-containing protein n=1 Tax=Streptococcus henryi TaxID=439219 RepID=UPI0003828A61|nr:GGDEF domain-containing protein [Streptococcus henryi]
MTLLETIISYVEMNFIVFTGIVYMLLHLSFNDEINKRGKFFFILATIMMLLDMLSFNFEQYLAAQPMFSIWRQFWSVIGYSCRPIIFLAIIFLNDASEKWTRQKVIVSAMALINLFLSFSTFFSKIAYWYTIDNRYYRGPLGYYSYIILLVYLLILVIQLLHLYKSYRLTLQVVVGGYLVLLTLAGIYFNALYTSSGISRGSMIAAIVFYYGYYNSVQYKAEHQRYSQIASQDGLTGLSNRYAYNQIINELKLSDEPIGFLMLDIDKFKAINDECGHDIGDRILSKVADYLRITFNETEYVFRIGGDEFVVLFTELNQDEVERISDKIDMINKMLLTENDTLPITSISAGLVTSGSNRIEKLYVEADRALYITKSNGGAGCTIL